MRGGFKALWAIVRERRFAVPGLAALALAVIVASLFAGGALRSRGSNNTGSGSTGPQSYVGNAIATSATDGVATQTQGNGTPSAIPTTTGETNGGSSGNGSGGQATPSSAGTPGSAGGTSPTPTGTAPCCAPNPTATPPAPTPTPDGYDGILVSVTPSPITLNSGDSSSYLTITVENTGTAPWYFFMGNDTFSIKCLTFCNTIIAIADPLPIQVLPGMQFIRHGIIQAPTTDLRGNYVSHWAMQHGGVTFGQDIAIPFTVRGWYTAVQQPAPACDNPAGTTWDAFAGSLANTIACTPSGLVLQQGATTSPRLTLTSAAGPYNPNALRLHVHVHFASSTSTAAATFLLHAPVSASQCGGDEYQLSPAGQMVWIFVRSDCSQTGSIVYNFPFAASQDFDVTISGSQSSDCFQINQGPAQCTTAFGFDGTAGLSVVDATASASSITFSDFALEQFGP